MSGKQDSTISPRRLRNHSYQQSLAKDTHKQSTIMSGNLMDIVESMDNEQIIAKDDFQKKNTIQKLDSVADAINKMYEKMNEMNNRIDQKIQPVEEAVFDQQTGVVPQLQGMVEHARSADERIQTLVEENLQLRDELDILKGVVHKMANQMQYSSQKLDQLIARSMSENLIITGILNDVPKANVRKQVQAFFMEQMELSNIPDRDIIDAYRLGQPVKDRARPIVVQCVEGLRQYILDNATKLRDKSNENGSKFFVNPQLPDSLAEQRREIRQNIKQRKDQEQAIKKPNKSTFAVKNGKLYINGQQKRKLLTPPTVLQLFPDENDQKNMSHIRFKYLKKSKPEAGSEFRVALFRPQTLEEVRYAYIKLFQEFPSADHIAAAFSVQQEQDYQDNGEFGSGFRLLRCIKESGLSNLAVFLIRNYGGTNLGPRRFVIMTDMAKAAIQKFCQHRSPDSVLRSQSPSPPQSVRSRSPSPAPASQTSGSDDESEDQKPTENEQDVVNEATPTDDDGNQQE